MPDNLNLTSLSILVTDLHSLLTPSPASANRARITAIREDSIHDAEALASIFNDGVIIDDGSVAGRLRAILEATESRVVPGLQTGIEFHDNGFRGDRNLGGQGFKDPHLSSNNQVGHFLTAVGLSFNPAKLTERFFSRSLRDWLGIPVSMTDNEAALRLVIGHELAPDPTMSGIAKASAAGAATGAAVGGIAGSVAGTIAGGAVGAGTVILNGFRTQFQQTTDDDLTAFRNALDALGSDLLSIDMHAAEPLLQPIRSKIDFTMIGCSIQDLRLSLAGWRLGRNILNGRFLSVDQLQTWVRNNLEEP